MLRHLPGGIPAALALVLLPVFSTSARVARAQPADEPPLLFAEDFRSDRVGTFPRRLEFLGGQADVVERGGRRLLRATTNKTWFKVPLDGALPEKFTIELDLLAPDGLDGLVVTTAETGSVPGSGYRHPFLRLGHRAGSGVYSALPKYGPRVVGKYPRLHDELTPLRITADGPHVKVYAGEELVADVPDAPLPRGDTLWVVVPRARDDHPLYVGNLRVARGIVDLPDTVARTGDDDAAADTGPDLGVWDNYEFVTGDEILFAEDFADDPVASFPERLTLLDGQAVVVAADGGRVLRITENKTWFKVPLPRVLPDRFTLEMDVRAPSGLDGLVVTTSETSRTPAAYHKSPFLQIGHRAGTGVKSSQPRYGPTSTSRSPRIHDRLTPVRVMVDGDYVQVYVDENRVANAPSARMPRSNELWVVVPRARDTHPVDIGSIRVAAGGRKLYDALVAEGRVAARGILFDTSRAEIRPESTPVLKEIGSMLRDHPELSLRIEGHTDAVGDDASNQALSGRRAEAVRDWLTRHYEIDAARLQAVGRGESEPVAPNDTEEGRQMNRRVELVRVSGG